MLCIDTLRHQQKLLIQEGKGMKEKLHYGKPVIASIEAGVTFIEKFFPDIRKSVKKTAYPILRKSN